MKVITPLKGKTDKSWFFEQGVYDSEGIIYKGKEIEPYESFYHNTSDKFFRGQLGGYFSLL